MEKVKLQKAFGVIFMNILFATIILHSLFGDPANILHTYTTNITLFYIPATVIRYIMAVASKNLPSFKTPVRPAGKIFPVTVDIVLLIAFVAQGWFVYGAMQLIIMLLEESIFTPKPKPEPEPKQTGLHYKYEKTNSTKPPSDL